MKIMKTFVIEETTAYVSAAVDLYTSVRNVQTLNLGGITGNPHSGSTTIFPFLCR